MSPDLEKHLRTVRELSSVEPVAELPRLFAALEEIRTSALIRITRPPLPPIEERLLDVRDAAVLLGVAPAYLYRHHGMFPFVRRMGKRLLFSAAGIQRYIQQQR